MTLESITCVMNDEKKTKEEKIRILRRDRAQLLDEIHGKQQLLDQLDYIIHVIKENQQRI